MTILITAPNKFTGDDLVVGRYYTANEISEGTLRQNDTFHALLQCYWESGCHSYNARNIPEFKIEIKKYLGVGKEQFYNHYDKDGNPLKVPELMWRLKSWGDYTKKERKETISRLIAEMETVGVDTPKYHEILAGLENRQAENLAMEAAR